MSRLRLLLSLVLLVALFLSLGTGPMPAKADDEVRIMAGNFLAQYYNNTDLSGSPVLTRTDATINFHWGAGSPDATVNADNFSARWTGTVHFGTAGEYVFSLTTDDGARLWVDDVLLLDKWFDQSPTTYTHNRVLTTGSHTIKMEYYEHLGEATAVLTWGMAGSAETFAAEYFNNTTVSGPPAFTAVATKVSFDWGYGSPDATINPDYFSARWVATVNFASENDYDFHLYIDDGAKLWLDGVLILSRWYPQAPTHHMVTRHVTAGPHQVKMEYFERTGVAVARLWWDVHPVGGDVIVDDLSPGFTRGGAWHEAAIGYLGHMYWTRNAYSVQENWGRWTPTLPGSGVYEVYVFIPSNYATSRNARYSVYHSGHWATRSVNQYIYYDAWVSLGMFCFTGTGGEFVFLNDVTYEPYLSRMVGFDAVKFVYRMGCL